MDSSELPPDKTEIIREIKSYYKKQHSLVEISEIHFHGEVLSPVRDQLEVGACALVSSISCIEMKYKMRKVKIQDCFNYFFDIDDVHNNVYKKYKNPTKANDVMNKQGSKVSEILRYAKEHGLLITNEAMNPRGKNLYAKFCNEYRRYKISSFEKLRANEEVYAFVLSNESPIIASMTVTRSFGDCQEIVYNGCKGDKDIGVHGVLIVGNVTLRIGNKSRKYFIIQNSWGKKFGYKGFTLMLKKINTFLEFWLVDIRPKLNSSCLKGDLHFSDHELATVGSLHDILHGRQKIQGAQSGPILDWMQRVRIAVDVARDIEYLHEKADPSIIHGHIRSNNVLLFENYEAKIYFDISNQTAHLLQPSSDYQAPEFAITRQLTQKSDVYDFGIVLLELLTGNEPVDLITLLKERCLATWVVPSLTRLQLTQIVDRNLEGNYPEKGVDKLVDIAASCLHEEPELRPTMSIVLKVMESLLMSLEIQNH